MPGAYFAFMLKVAFSLFSIFQFQKMHYFLLNILIVGHELEWVVIIEFDLVLVNEVIVLYGALDERQVLALQVVEVHGVVRLGGEQRHELAVVTDVHGDVAVGRHVGEGADGVAGLGVPLDDHGVLALVRGDDEGLVLRHGTARDDVHVALQLDVGLRLPVLDHSRVGGGLEQLPGFVQGQVVHRLHEVFVKSYDFLKFYGFFYKN